MPEAPEVDALALYLREGVSGAAVGATDLLEFRALKTRPRPLTELEGRVVTGVHRRGKHIVIDTGGTVLVVSFGRAGWATWQPEGPGTPGAAPEAPVIATIDFPGRGRLGLTDAGAWLSLGLSVAGDPDEVPAVARLGPDPTTDDFTREVFERIVTGRRKRLKALLQEQESLAGIGNAYSDEILHAARLSPLVQAASLDSGERARLFEAVRAILGQAVADRRTVPIDQQKAAKVAAMRVHGRGGQPCPVCGAAVRDVPGSEGAAQYCPGCQTGGLALPE